MAWAVDEHLDRMALLDEADRRNGSYRRHLLTELGEIELAVPRTRRFALIGVVRAYARRPEPGDRMILACLDSNSRFTQSSWPGSSWPSTNYCERPAVSRGCPAQGRGMTVKLIMKHLNESEH
jgi:hypothetical protein